MIWNLVTAYIRACTTWQLCATMMGLYFASWGTMIYGVRGTKYVWSAGARAVNKRLHERTTGHHRRRQG